MAVSTMNKFNKISANQSLSPKPTQKKHSSHFAMCSQCNLGRESILHIFP